MITIKGGKDLNLKDNDEIETYFTNRSSLDMPESVRNRIVNLLHKETLTEGAKELYLRYFQPPALKTKTAMINDVANFIVGTETTNQ